MYVVKRIVEARSCNHCCCVKAINMVYSDCLFVSLDIQNTMHMGYIVICGPYGFKVYFHLVS